MSTLPTTRYSPSEYLSFERGSDQKHEFFRGEVFAMVGASERHNLIVINFASELRAKLKHRPCKVYPSDMRVKVDATGLYTYPDVSVVCGDAELEDDQFDTLLNPLLIVEVLSKSTEDYDRGRKFGHYRRLESLAEYVLVSQDKPHVECYRRQADGQWLLWETSRLEDVVELSSLECEIALAEIYDKVDLSAEEPA
jgi:Uma2 family endonuclease